MRPTRQPAGTPTGGQFATGGQGRSTLTLHIDDLNQDGTDAFPDQLVLGESRPTVDEDGAIRDGRYDHMTRGQAWADYRRRHPAGLPTTQREQDGRWPGDDIIGYTNADPSTLSVDPEHFQAVDYPHRQDWCGVCGRPTDHFGEHDGYVEAGIAEYRNGQVWPTDAWNDELAREIREREDADYQRLLAQPEPVHKGIPYTDDTAQEQ